MSERKRMPPNNLQYLRSLSEELLVQANRVRSLIGDRHWLSDGHHKEYLLMELLGRHVPSSYSLSRGFVVSPRYPDNISKELDILISDSSIFTPLFQQGDLSVIFPESLSAIVSVKTTLCRAEIVSVLEGVESIARFHHEIPTDNYVWTSGFFFKPTDGFTSNPDSIIQVLSEEITSLYSKIDSVSIDSLDRIRLDCLCTANNLFFDIQYAKSAQDGSYNIIINGYECDGIATAYFLCHLLPHLTHRRGVNDADFERYMTGLDTKHIGSNTFMLKVRS